MNDQQLLELVEEYVKRFFQTHHDDRLVYHNFKHTEQVVKHATAIANHYQLNDHDFFILLAAAWFHDTGYFITLEDHETAGANLAESFLKEQNLPEEDIVLVKSAIFSTRMPQNPSTLLEKILCDADLYHLGTDAFEEKNKLMRKEFNDIHHLDNNKLQWNKHSVEFLKSHQYHTDYCQLLLNQGKQKNLEELEARVEKWQKEEDEKIASEQKKSQEESKKLQEKQILPEVKDSDKPKKKKERPERGVETMFRISSTNHQRLSDMADNKAHILITVNSIILSAIISLLLRRLSEYENLIIPTAIILIVSLLAMIFAILATRPSLPPGTFTRNDIDEKKVNLLFFGNFYRMPLDEYAYGMSRMMEDRDFLYGSLTRDLYSQGIVLGKKYRLLRVAYNIFMFGLIVAVLAFIIAAAFFGEK
ncbi:DUF5706 domain-containing protein [Mucilaginibacter sp. RS28]|uniref:DUF5706 domain-containing protein n=1 Tax=Mucilaginibacter straminoryzae TaxID=2932774 RepID=A0A9X1X632_9SPHI|nr:Pycsar system effector family protein [Mucilaginibacter straminoryzae]MCJ8211812.1 DUF5706 domain-containing protein [Mucilaginibacter straminoryzae]